MDNIALRQFLDAQLPDKTNYPNVYALGSAELRVTVYSQQLRALNLIYALRELGLIEQGKWVAIVGAGVSGLTAAAAALRLGCRVCLLEKAGAPLSVQWGTRHRWLDPTIYDWPFNIADDSDAASSLPVLKWRAGLAGTVAREIVAEWHELVSGAAERLKEVWNLSTWSVEAPCTISWAADGDQHRTGRQECAAIILAVGFGKERSVTGHDATPYWSDDNLERPNVSPDCQILVSGVGDGGLIDLLRARVKDFQQESLRSLVSAPLRARIKQTAEDAQKTSHAPGWLYAQYDLVEDDKGFLELDQALKARSRSDAVATLNGEGEHIAKALSPTTASFLHSVLVHRLSKWDSGFSYQGGKIDHVEKADERWKIVAPPFPLNGRVFDRVIIRHGAHSPYESEPALAPFKEGLKRLRTRPNLDLLPRPFWPAKWWDESAPEVTVAPAIAAVKAREGAGSATGGTAPYIPVAKALDQAVWACLETMVKFFLTSAGVSDARATLHRIVSADSGSVHLQQVSRYAGTRGGGEGGRVFSIGRGLAGRVVRARRSMSLCRHDEDNLCPNSNAIEQFSAYFGYSRADVDYIEDRTKTFVALPLFSVSGPLIGVLYVDSLNRWDPEAHMTTLAAACAAILHVAEELRDLQPAPTAPGYRGAREPEAPSVELDGPNLVVRCHKMNERDKDALYAKRLRTLLLN